MTLKHINRAGSWPSGNPRLYYRPKGQKGVALPDLPMDHPKFLAAYVAAAGGRAETLRAPIVTGSIGAAIVAFIRSDRYASAAVSTRSVWRRHLDRMRTAYGSGKLTDLRAPHIRADLSKLAPNPAVQRRKVWRALMTWCVDQGWIETSPADAVAKPRAPKGDGRQPWTHAELAKFRAHWPIGTAQRTAAELLAYTGARISDALRMGPGMIDAQGWLVFIQKKTGGLVELPLTAPAPTWAGTSAELLRAIDAMPDRHLVWMTTAQGAARSDKAASQWFSAAARAAGITGKGAHGLRAWRANDMKEKGATADQRASWLGHESVRQTEAYSRQADRRLILAAPAASTEQELESSNSKVGLGTAAAT